MLRRSSVYVASVRQLLFSKSKGMRLPAVANRLKRLITSHHHPTTLRQIEPPPLNALRCNAHSQPRRTPTRNAANPDARKIPEDVSAVTGKRLDLHNRILRLIQAKDLQEAMLLTHHSIYSNCKPTIFTCNMVMAACLRQYKYDEFLTFVNFITLAPIAANIVTYNLIISYYMDCGKTDFAMSQYRLLIDDAPFDPNTTTYRIIVKGLVDNDKLEKALQIKEEMLSKGIKADPVVYAHLMFGFAKNNNPDGIFNLHEELKDKLDGIVLEGLVKVGLLKGYMLIGMEKEAAECYKEVLGGPSQVKMSTEAYNSMLEVLSKNGKFKEAMNLFDEMLADHNPPRFLTLDLASYNVMVNAYCAEKRFDEAISIFNKMGEKCCHPDTVSFNNLIKQLSDNGLLTKAENLYTTMNEKQVNPNECTFAVLMNTCFKENRPADAIAYYMTMIQSKVGLNPTVYNQLMDGLVKAGKVDEAKSFFDMMVTMLGGLGEDSYKFIMKALFDIKKHDEVLEIILTMLRENPSRFSGELQVFVREELKKEDRENDLVKLLADVKREKDEVAKAAERDEAIAFASFYPTIKETHFPPPKIPQ